MSCFNTYYQAVQHTTIRPSGILLCGLETHYEEVRWCGRLRAGLASVWACDGGFGVAGLEGCEAEANVHYDAMLHSIHAFLSDFPECFACAQPLE